MYETIAPLGLLQPLRIPQQCGLTLVWTLWLVYPMSIGKSIIMVMVDRLSEYAHFIALAHPYNATTLAQEFVENIFKLYGMPTTIVSDNNFVFLNALWREFFKLHGSKLCMSSGYHPHSDGQIEVVNRCLETYLRCFNSNQPRKWLQWHPWAELSYTTSFHTSAQFTPFEIVYGYPPPHLSTMNWGLLNWSFWNKGC